MFKSKKQISFENINALLSVDYDFKHRCVKVADMKVHVLYIDGIVDQQAISRYIIEPMVSDTQIKNAKSGREIAELIKNGIVYYCDCEEAATLSDAVGAIVSAKCVVVTDDGYGFIFDVRKIEKRGLEDPSEESALKGAKDCFIEDIKVNTGLVRKRIKNPDLVFEKVVIGKQTMTSAVIVYFKNITNDKIVDGVREKLEKIDFDGTFLPSAVQEYLTEKLSTPFPQVMLTERPDKFCTGILNGRVGVIIDGIPFVYIVPVALAQFISTPQDYAQSSIYSTVVRVLRYVLLFVSLFITGVYVALNTYHYEMIPTTLALSISAAKLGVPFPVFIEIIGMLVIFEVLMEAGIHMPQNTGQAVSIVGALVVGQSAITAKLISPAAMIIVSIAVISSYAMPNQSLGNSIRLWRIIITAGGRIAGLYGVTITGLILLARLAQTESFGVPYLAPFSGERGSMLREMTVSPNMYMQMRPKQLETKNRRRTRILK